MASSILAKMAVQISANTADFNRTLKAASGNLKGFTSNVQSAAGAIGIAFGVQQVSQFAIELTKLAGEAEGVRAAFDRLPDSVALMSRLKEATHNTVSELDLMKRSVMAANFGISLEALPKLLEFATLRAQQTGQSVDYLVDSIVTGIGRKSKLILDNLGISAVQLDEALGGASTQASSIGEVAEAVGKIAQESLGKMGEYSNDAATQIQQLSAAWEDLKVKAGSSIASIIADPKNANALLTNLKNQLVVWGDESISVWAKIFGSAQEYAEMVAEIERKQKLIASGAVAGPTGNPLFTGEWLKKAKELNKELQKTVAVDELFKSKANLDFKKDIVPNVSNVLIESRPKNIEGTESFMPEQVNIPTELQSQVDGIKAMYKTISEENAKLAQSFADLATTLFESVGNSIGSGENLGRGLLKALARFGVQYGAQLIAIGAAKIAEGIVTENPKAVSAGIFAVAKGGALVVASSALGGAMSRGQSSSGGGSYYDRRPSVSSNFQGSASSYQVDFKIRGSDLVGAMQAAQSDIRIRKGG